MQTTFSGESVPAIDAARRRWWVLDGDDLDDDSVEKASAPSTSSPSSSSCAGRGALTPWGGSSRSLKTRPIQWVEPGTSRAIEMLIEDADVEDGNIRLLAPIFQLNVAPFLHFDGPLPNQLYACGGRDECQEPLSTVEMFDTWWGRWVTAPSMLTRRAGCSAALLPSGELMIVGGYDERGIVEGLLASVELFDPKHQLWRPASTSLRRARWGHGSAVLGGRVYVVGGCSLREGAPPDEDFMETLRTCEVYDPDQEVWSVCPSVNTPRAGGRLVALSGTRLAIVGGCDDVFGRSEVLSSVEIFDAETERWSLLQHELSVPRTTAAVAAVNAQEILVFGGTPGALDSAWNESSCEIFEVLDNSSLAAAATEGAAEAAPEAAEEEDEEEKAAEAAAAAPSSSSSSSSCPSTPPPTYPSTNQQPLHVEAETEVEARDSISEAERAGAGAATAVTAAAPAAAAAATAAAAAAAAATARSAVRSTEGDNSSSAANPSSPKRAIQVPPGESLLEGRMGCQAVAIDLPAEGRGFPLCTERCVIVVGGETVQEDEEGYTKHFDTCLVYDPQLNDWRRQDAIARIPTPRTALALCVAPGRIAGFL